MFACFKPLTAARTAAKIREINFLFRPWLEEPTHAGT